MVSLSIRQSQLFIDSFYFTIWPNYNWISFSIRIDCTILCRNNHGISVAFQGDSIKVIISLSPFKTLNDSVTPCRAFPPLLPDALGGVAEFAVLAESLGKGFLRHVLERCYARVADLLFFRSAVVRVGKAKRFHRLLDHRLRHALDALVGQKIFQAAVVLAPLHRIGDGVCHRLRQSRRVGRIHSGQRLRELFSRRRQFKRLAEPLQIALRELLPETFGNAVGSLRRVDRGGGLSTVYILPQ